MPSGVGWLVTAETAASAAQKVSSGEWNGGLSSSFLQETFCILRATLARCLASAAVCSSSISSSA